MRQTHYFFADENILLNISDTPSLSNMFVQYFWGGLEMFIISTGNYKQDTGHILAVEDCIVKVHTVADAVLMNECCVPLDKRNKC